MTALGRRRRPAIASPERRRAQGQGLVEFAVLVPMFMLLLMGMLEFGLAFSHHQTLQYATREGARAGAALSNGGGKLGCSTGQSPNRADVDPQIIAAVERVLTSEGSPVKNNLSQIPVIKIYLADANGNQIGGSADTWTYNPGAGPSVDGKNLDYTLSSKFWDACNRNANVTTTVGAMSLGVSLTYTYRMQTGMSAIMGFFGGRGATSITMNDKTVMNVNPTNLNVTP